MADITLAEFNNRVWLVGGEIYVDDLLANTLAPNISIEMVQCESSSDVHELWVQNCGEPKTAGTPWLIHPNIAARIRRSSPDYRVFFAQWSAMLDAEATAVVRAAASWALQTADAPIVLVEFLDPDGPQMVADLSRIRTQLIEEKLVECGIPRARIGRDRRAVGDAAGASQESQRVDIVVRVA